MPDICRALRAMDECSFGIASSVDEAELWRSALLVLIAMNEREGGWLAGMEPPTEAERRLRRR